MSRTRGTMQEIANPGSEFTWATYAFAGNDPLEAALAPGYFAQWASRLQPGDLILGAATRTGPAAAIWASRSTSDARC